MELMRKIIIMLIVSLIGLQARSENFSCTIHDAKIVGTDSTLICIMDGEKIQMDIPDGMRIKGIDSFGEGVIAITEGRNILFWDSPLDKARKRRFDIKGQFIAIDSGHDICYVLSDCSEIISLNLALQGKIFDFNANYSEYYGTVSLIDIACGSLSVCVGAIKENGLPTAFTSSKGNVWSERELNYAVNGIWHIFEKVPHSITYEELSDNFVLHCEDGTEFHLPSCSHCNYVVDPTTL